MNILIIGAGAAGLMAAHLLSKNGHRITILEARSRIGGRIHTKVGGSFAQPVELGAEFVHGDLTITLGLLDEAGIPYHKAGGEMWHFRDGMIYEDDTNGEYWGELMEKLDARTEDLPVKEFLDQEFPGKEYESFRQSVEGYVQGMDAADPADASAFALRKELGAEDEDQYRIEGGYGRLLTYLRDQCTAKGAVIHLDQKVTALQWQENGVSATTAGGEIFQADKAVVTLPIGVLQAAPEAEGAISFTPGIPEYLAAIRSMGSGHCIKLLLQFREPFWANASGNDLSRMSFLLSDAPIPTWWTQCPAQSPLLTGWIGGPQAYLLKDLSKEELLQKGIRSLSEIFNIKEEKIRHNLDDYAVAAWPAHSYSRGSYSYVTVATKAALALLKAPIGGSIYFAGEAIYNGPSMGTVEAALTSAKEVAAAITGAG